MGACFSDRTIKRKNSDSFFHLKSPHKYGDHNSSIKFRLQTWQNQILPDLRNQTQSNILETVLNNEGCLTYNPKTKDLSFKSKATQLQTRKIITKNNAKNNQLSINVQKTSSGYSVTFLNEFIYELITAKRQITEGDKFLFGGTQYKFVKFIHDTKYAEHKVKSIESIKDPNTVRTQEYMKSFTKIDLDDGNQNPLCRICLDGQIDKSDPLICPCDCIGSVKYFHLKCWSSWIFSSEISHEGLYIGNVIKDECELCKKNLIQNQFFRETVAALLSSVAKIKPPLIVLQGLKSRAYFPYYLRVKLNYIIVSFAEKDKYLVGRGKGTDIPLVIDNSISRNNSYLQMKDGKIYLEDAGSKHGTYIKVKGPITVENDVPRYFLYDNQLVSMRID